MRCAVVGHVEWVEFARVPHMPAAGEIVHADRAWTEPAGGGGVVARQLALLAGRCELLHGARATTSSAPGGTRRLAELGIDVHVAAGAATTRRAWTHVDTRGERTITVLGEKLRPAAPLPLDGYDAVFFVAGDEAALRVGAAAALPRRDGARAADAPAAACRSTCSSAA